MLPRLLVLTLALLAVSIAADRYTEELVVSRLPTGNLLSQFRFVIRSDSMNPGPDYELFPRILSEILSRHSVQQLSLSLAQGRWWADKWGLPPQPSSPTGAQVHAWIEGNETEVDSRWQLLVNSLNGVFCTSLNSIVPTMTSSPTMTFAVRGGSREDWKLRYGAISRESLCTENLTPWKKLLPCKQNGLTTLLNPLKLYASMYHSMAVTAVRTCGMDKDTDCGWRLDLSLNMVTDVDLRTKKLDWDFDSLFGRHVGGHCHAADSSQIIVGRDLEDQELAPKPASSSEKFSVFSLTENSTYPFNVVASYRTKLDLSRKVAKQPISIHSVLGGTDQHLGVMLTRIVNGGAAKRVLFSHQIPWFVQMYYHTLKMECRDSDTNSVKPVTWFKRTFVPAQSRRRPYLIEWEFQLPEKARCEVKFEFVKAHLRLREYPPDANHGMYVPAAILTVIDTDEFEREHYARGSERCTAGEVLAGSPSCPGPVVLYSNVLLVALPTPDFSMPFNVICFVLTAISLCFGPLHNFSTKMLIPVNTKLPTAKKYKKILRVFLLILLGGACYAQYHDIPLNEVRRAIEKAFAELKEGFEKMNSM